MEYFDGNNLFNPNLMKENNSNSDKTTTISASYNPQQPNQYNPQQHIQFLLI